MSLHNKLIYSFVAAACLSSCVKLDLEPMNGTLTDDQREDIFDKYPDRIESLANGLYNSYSGSGGATSFGWGSIMASLDCRTADFVAIYPNSDDAKFYQCVEYLDNTYDNGFVSTKWSKCYGIIYTANEVISYMNALDPEEEDATYNNYKAQALGNRAFGYLNLIQFFQKTYASFSNPGDASVAKGVPLVTELNQKEAVNNGLPRGSVQDVYDFIFNDLDHAIALIENSKSSRQDKRYIDINVLYGLRARAALLSCQWEKAIESASYLINSGNFSPLSVDECKVPGFGSLSASNWIWGCYYSPETYTAFYTFPSFISSFVMGYTSSSNQWKLINQSLFDKISYYDVRKLWWIDLDGRSAADYYTSARSEDGQNAIEYLRDHQVPTYSNVKFGAYDNILGSEETCSDVPLMRIEEMYYILAEAQYMEGQTADAQETLENFVNDYRWTGNDTYSCADAMGSPEAFRDEIFFQRRVEFWGEGLTYLDILRLQKPVDRREENSLWLDENLNYFITSYAFYVEPTNPVLIFPIPRSEIEYNKAMDKEKDQNPTGQATL